MRLKTTAPEVALKKQLNQTISREGMDRFKENLISLLDKIEIIEKQPKDESEEHLKNNIRDFLRDTFYKGINAINTKDKKDLVIHLDQTTNSKVGVLIEAKRPTNISEMVTVENANKKALYELILYYFNERKGDNNNQELKRLIVTNINKWYIIDANYFDKHIFRNKDILKLYKIKINDKKDNPFFYEEIAKIASSIDIEIPCVYFDIHDYEDVLRNKDEKDNIKLKALYKILSPEYLLKKHVTNDSNKLDKGFYNELLHIIGLNETKVGSKKLIGRHKTGERFTGSLIENTIIQLDSLDKINRLVNPNQYGATHQDRLYNVALELCLTWINRILFLKLLEAQLITYHQGDTSYKFLNFKQIHNYDDLNSLFFQVLAKKKSERNEDVKTELFDKIPYLNSSLFEPSEVEQKMIIISNLKDDKTIPLLSSTVLKDKFGKKLKGVKNSIEYLFEFLNAFDYGSKKTDLYKGKQKTLITASVLGLIFEKINGYKDGSFFTPGFITMYMSRETIRKAVVQKFNEAKGWNCNSFDELSEDLNNEIFNNSNDRKVVREEANHIINSLKICDPAVGSGHFLVSVLNEIICIKSKLQILVDEKYNPLSIKADVVNDELEITESNRDDEKTFIYNPNDTSKNIQKTLFHEKQTIIESCLFGVDINPNSVKICRLRLWIELLKNAYYKEDGQLQTLPNIDINIKCGNSLISRFDLDADIGKTLKKSKWNIETYRLAVDQYRNATSKEQKHNMERLIADIKGDFRSEISDNDPKVKRLQKFKGDLFNLTNQTYLFEQSKKEISAWNKKVKTLTTDSLKLENEIDEIKNNKIYENAFEWRFEFPEILDDNGDFVGFDAIIGNPPYVQLSKAKNLLVEEKKYLLNRFGTSGGRLNTFIFFTHLGYDLLLNNRNLNYIIPNTILSQEYYSFTRDFLVNKVTLNEIVGFPVLPFEDAVVETVLIQYNKSQTSSYDIPIKELTQESIYTVSNIKTNTINRDDKFSFVYSQDPIIEKSFENEHFKFGDICNINQGIALKGDKSLSLKDHNENGNYYKLLDGRNINRYKIVWDGVYLDYDIDRIHSCKRKDIFETTQGKLFFRRVSSSLIFTYDDSQYFALNTLVVVNKIDSKTGPNVKFILGLMNSKLMNYIYTNKFKSTKTVFSEIQARSVKELPVIKPESDKEIEITQLVERIIEQKKKDIETTELENQINKLVFELYGITEEEIKTVENASA